MNLSKSIFTLNRYCHKKSSIYIFFHINLYHIHQQWLSRLFTSWIISSTWAPVTFTSRSLYLNAAATPTIASENPQENRLKMYRKWIIIKWFQMCSVGIEWKLWILWILQIFVEKKIFSQLFMAYTSKCGFSENFINFRFVFILSFLHFWVILWMQNIFWI